MNSLLPSTVKYLQNTSLQYRKKMGQYFTPTHVTDIIFKHLTVKNEDIVLDPAVGTGELLYSVYKRNPSAQLIGFDVDDNILNVAKLNIPSGVFKNHSLFSSVPEEMLNTVDIIITNPPYFQVKKTEHNLESFTTINGRANMFALFFEKYTPLLKTGGKFVAIIPPSMNNGAYFQKLREYIISHYKIDFLTVLRKDLFLDAQQATQILILTKTSHPSSTNKYVVDFKTLLSQPDLPIIFTDNKKLLTSFWKNKTNLNSLGFTVKTGTILWNENKQNLSSKETPNNTVLYYSKDIKNNKLSLSPLLQHKRFLTSNKPVLATESIIVNRVIGSIHNPSLKCAYVNTNKYYVENHLNVIQATTKNIISLQEVFNRLSATDYKKYLQALTGNTQLSAKELLYLIPL